MIWCSSGLSQSSWIQESDASLGVQPINWFSLYCRKELGSTWPTLGLDVPLQCVPLGTALAPSHTTVTPRGKTEFYHRITEP